MLHPSRPRNLSRLKKKMMESKKQQESSNWWWFDRLSMTNSNQKRSPWLQSTLSELDEKTKAMLKLIEEDADSFAQRAEMYYKKRPELISMVEDFYRTHRLLAERYDQFKSESGTRLIASWASPLSLNKCHRPEKLTMSLSSMDKSYDSYSETYGTEDLEESDVEDPEPEEEVQYNKEMQRNEFSNCGGGNSQVMKLMEEIERLKEENRTQKEQLTQKDDEKRDVIRQLSLAMNLLREENVELKKRVAKDSAKRQNHFEVNKLEVFWRRLFN